MSKLPPSEWTDVAKTLLQALNASSVLVEKCEGWQYVSDDGVPLVDEHNVMYHVTVYKGGKTVASGGGRTTEAAIQDALKRTNKDTEGED